MNKLNINKMKILFSFSLLVGQIMKASTLDSYNNPNVDERIQQYEYVLPERNRMIERAMQVTGEGEYPPPGVRVTEKEEIIEPFSLFGCFCFESKSSISFREIIISIFDCQS